MFLEPKNSWQPTASISTLQARAAFLRQIRDFFHERQVMEVDPPVLCQTAALEPHLQAFAIPDAQGWRYLQTSPEFPMKRLLAAGSGPIYSLGKAFRQGEVGRNHNPEFTMLEWYQPQWDHLALISEVQALFKQLLDCDDFIQTTYQALFETAFEINPHLASISELQTLSLQHGFVQQPLPAMDKDGWLDLLMTHHIEPTLGQQAPQVVIDYPASQASLAKTQTVINQTYQTAARFEVYYQGIELANGYHELSCPIEQRARFEADINKRHSLHLSTLPLDERLLAALPTLPESAGVAVGVDRLLRLKLGAKELKAVIPFNWANS